MSSEIEKIVLEELRLLQAEVQQVGKEIATLKVKAGLTGVIGGLVPAAGAVLWMLLK